MYAVDIPINVEYKDNGRFVGVGEKSKLALATGKFDCQPTRKPWDNINNSKRTVFTGIRHDMVENRLTPGSLSFAAYRLFHDKVGYNQLALYQVTSTNSSELHDYADFLSVLLQYEMASCDHITSVREESDKTHVKKRLRQRAFKELYERGEIADPGSEYMVQNDFVQISFKPGEWRVYDIYKYDRCTGNFGVAASLRASRLVDRLKSVWAANPLKLTRDNHETQFVYVKSPVMSYLASLYSRMMDGESLFLHHSDDGLFTLQCKDGVLICEKDISSCDSSNSPLVFDQLEKFVPQEYRRDIWSLISQ